MLCSHPLPLLISHSQISPAAMEKITQLPDKTWKFLTAHGVSWPITHHANDTTATGDGSRFSLVLHGTGCDYARLVSPLSPCVEERCPWFNEVGVAEGEVPGCDDGVGSNGGLRRLLQYSEQQLQVLVTQHGARREASIDHTHVCIEKRVDKKTVCLHSLVPHPQRTWVQG